MPDTRLEENILLVIFDGQTMSVDDVHREVTKLRRTASCTRDEVREVMEELRRNGFIAEASSRDVDGKPLQAPEWALTERGRVHKYTLDNPLGKWLERIPVVGKPANRVTQRIITGLLDFGRRRGA